jgi:hypothetical protein
MHTDRSSLFWRGLTLVSVFVYLFWSVLYVWMGQINMDEGWYLYASKLVYAGFLPYRDFAYTQTPLLPYVYGLPFLLQSSILTGRLTSLAFSIFALLVFLRVARRYGGDPAVALTAWLLATFTYGLYFVAIVKTYALVMLLVAGTLWALTVRPRHQWNYLAAAFCATLAAAARLSASALAVPVLVYCLWAAKRSRVRWSIGAMVAGIAIGFTILFAQNPQATEWNLLGHHLAKWGDATLAEKLAEIIWYRVPNWLNFYLPYVLLIVALTGSYLIARDRRVVGRFHVQPVVLPLLVYGLGLTLFGATHFVTGGWFLEYFVPPMIGGLPLLAIVAARVLTVWRTQRRARLLLSAALLLLPILAVIQYGLLNLDLSGGQTPLQEIAEVAAFVTQNSTRDDQIMALESLWVAIDSNRSVPPDMAMALFSLQPLDRQTAVKFHLVNCAMVVDRIANQKFRIIIISKLDRALLAAGGCDVAIGQALAVHYNLGLVKEQFGQFNVPVSVYVRKEIQ